MERIVGAKPTESVQMVARWLRGVLVVEAIFLLIAAAWLQGGNLTIGAALAACVGVVPLSFFIVAAIYAVVRLYATPRNGGAGALRCAIAELLALFAAFVVIQPFERWWMGDEALQPHGGGGNPIVLVHGYLCNRGLWWWARRRLHARGHIVTTINLEPPLGDIDRLAGQLGERIEAVLAETGADMVTLVTHSMGALASRAYLRQHGGARRVAKLVTLAAPHHGTRIARLGFGRNAREMDPNSEWLRNLNAETPPIPVVTVWSRDDEIIDPPDASRLAQAREVVLNGIGHVAMIFSPTVVDCLDAELTRR